MSEIRLKETDVQCAVIKMTLYLGGIVVLVWRILPFLFLPAAPQWLPSFGLLNRSCELLISILKSFTVKLQFIIIPHTITLIQKWKLSLFTHCHVMMGHDGTWETTEKLRSMYGFRSFQSIKIMHHKSGPWSIYMYGPCAIFHVFWSHVYIYMAKTEISIY